jgi:hypothetical protein
VWTVSDQLSVLLSIAASLAADFGNVCKMWLKDQHARFHETTRPADTCLPMCLLSLLCAPRLPTAAAKAERVPSVPASVASHSENSWP